MVVIEECRPLSKTKHFKIVDKVGSQSWFSSGAS
jgi:ribosomal protein S17